MLSPFTLAPVCREEWSLSVSLSQGLKNESEPTVVVGGSCSRDALGQQGDLFAGFAETGDWCE